MKVAAVIAEFNPFHNGHAYFLREVRARSGADYVLVVMSGDFVQRGAPAVVDKYARTKMALDGGANLVLELPAAASLGSAGEFAAGAVALLHKTGIVDELWFGSECGRTEAFVSTAAWMVRESDSFRITLQEALATGLSYPAARAAAARTEWERRNPGRPFVQAALFSEPNNILGLEYCVALGRLGSHITPRTLRRTGGAYHDADMARTPVSAEAIRGALLGGSVTDCSVSQLAAHMPEEAAGTLTRMALGGGLLTQDDFSRQLFYQLLRGRREDLLRIHGMTEDLANRILHLAPEVNSVTDLAEAVKAKHLTRTGIDRLLFRILLGIDDACAAKAADPVFGRVLGFRDCEPLPGLINARASIPIYMRVRQIPEELYRTDFFAAQLYEWVRAGKTGEKAVSEYRRRVVK